MDNIRQSEKYSVLVLAPHQDDELALAGQIIPTLLESDVECYLAFLTNGDFEPWDARTRFKESIKAARKLGIKRSSIFFMGYCDSSRALHLYHAFERPVAASDGCSHTRTFSIDYPTVSERLFEKQKPYFHQSAVEDITGLLLALLPEVIICVDYDSHPDHRALSQLFEEAMGNILRNQQGYKPLILKKFAYDGCWFGPKDYASMLPTERPYKKPIGFELENPSYAWEDRLRFAVHPSTLTRKFKRNLIYKAARKYASQVAWGHVAGCCNSDAVYWLRRTDNLLYEASKIEVSSGSSAALLDFRHFDTNDISAECSLDSFSDFGWTPEANDSIRQLSVSFEEAVEVVEIILTVPVQLHSDCVSYEVWFQSGEKYRVVHEAKTPTSTKLTLEKPVLCNELTVQCLPAKGRQIGLSSVELFSCTEKHYKPLNTFYEYVRKYDATAAPIKGNRIDRYDLRVALSAKYATYRSMLRKKQYERQARKMKDAHER